MTIVEAIYDATERMVICKLEGFMTEQDLDRYERDLTTAVALARRDGPAIRMLFDTSRGVVQSQASVDRMREFGTSIRQPEDRLAIVVHSSLQKLQATRAIDSRSERVFKSMPEATTWLREALP